MAHSREAATGSGASPNRKRPSRHRQPGIGDLVSMLVHQAHDGSKLAREVSGHFPTAAFAAFEIKGERLHAAGPTLIAAWKPDRGD